MKPTKNKLLEYSQAGQDHFALSVAKNKSYIEIGANDFRKSNNTYPLEVNHQWQGFSLELNKKKFEQRWNAQTERKNKIYWENAIAFDYCQAMLENDLSARIGYLSCDIEPAENTFLALQKVINDGIVFDCITFEHDYYTNKLDYHNRAYDFLKDHGYKIAITGVYAMNNPKKVFETWFVNVDIDFKPTDYDSWKASL